MVISNIKFLTCSVRAMGVKGQLNKYFPIIKSVGSSVVPMHLKGHSYV